MNTVLKTLVLMICCGTISSSAFAQCSPKNRNYLTNSSFNEKEKNWQIRGDAFVVEVLDPGTDDANSYLSISDPDVLWSQDIAVPTQALSTCIGGLVKNTVSGPKSGWAVLEFAVLDASGKTLKSQQLPHIKPGTHWQKIRKTEQLPAAAAKIRVRLRAKHRPNIPMEHEARFDDLFVRFGK